MLDEIPNFPQWLMDRHMNWHTGTPPDGRTISQGSPGSGAEFLDFHHQFITDLKAWYATQPGADMSRVAAWSHFPPDLAAAYSPELDDFDAYASDASNFTSEDALGIYVEAEHNAVHGYVAAQYDTPAFGGFHSCMFFMFYQWHGLIDSWRGNWLVHHKLAIKDVFDGPGHKVIRDKIVHVDKPRVLDTKVVIEIPPKSPKELVEVPGALHPGGDPIDELAARVAQLENVVHRRAFIRKAERPDVR